MGKVTGRIVLTVARMIVLQGINVLQGGRKFDQCGEIGHFKVVLERDISKFSAVGLYGQGRKVEQKISDSDKKTNKKRRW